MNDTTHTIPVIELWGQLLVPLQGEIRDSQVDDLTRTVLARIRDRRAAGLIIDASGVWMMDSHLCATVGKLAASARLMGARSVLCGLSAEVVLTLQSMGIELDGVETALALEPALERLGVRVSFDVDDSDPQGSSEPIP
jgi:rsbT antagonist protein RsbS